MNPKIQVRPKRGRPSAGKKAFLVRMPPLAYVSLQRLALENDQSVGDFLAQLQGVRRERIADDAMPDFESERRTIVMLTLEACRLFEILHDLADLDPRIADDDSVTRAFSKMEAKRKKLKDFLKRELPNRFGKT